jgi:methanogenic corrinoid protein MtbC1
MVGDALERAGFEVQLVGADVPLEALLSAVARYSPAALGLSVTMPQPDTLRRAIERIQQVDPALAVLVGGAGVPPELRESPAPRYVATADASVDALEALLPAAA